MPIVVSCRCGKRFAAKDHLFGRQMPCPACGALLTVGREENSGPAGVYVSCKCGRAFVAPEAMRGQQARCRGCGRTIQVPGPDPIGFVHAAPAADASSPFTAPAPASDDDLQIPWTKLKLIGAIGGSILLLLIVVTTIIEYWPR